MNKLKYLVLLTIMCLSLLVSGQCSFKYISNDTTYQDYIDFIYPIKSKDKIIAIGSRKNRGIINDSIFNAPVFKVFDYCGNMLKNKYFEYIGNCILKHGLIPTHNTYKEEPLGNTEIGINDNEFLLVDKAVDTLRKQSVLISYRINEEGSIINYKTIDIDNIRANFTTIKHVLNLRDGKILVILWDFNDTYYFYYFDENSNYLYTKQFTLGRGIRAIKEIGNGEFIISSLSYDKYSFQFYRFDTIDSIKWIATPYLLFGGTIRDIKIVDDRIYLTGGAVLFGDFIISDFNGNILKELKFDNYYCSPSFCSTYIESDNSFFIGGYVEHCQSTDSSGSDIAIINIDTNGTILWDKLYDFRNALGTAGPNGKYTDYGGFLIDKTNDGGIVTNGMSRYSRLFPGGLLYEDALLIKTEPLIITNTIKPDIDKYDYFELMGNLVINNLNLTGPLELIANWKIFSIQGESVTYGTQWTNSLDISQFESGIYILKIFDRNKHSSFIKFFKL